MGVRLTNVMKVLSSLVISSLALSQTAQAGVMIPPPQAVTGDGQTAVYIPILADELDIRASAKVELGAVEPTIQNGQLGLLYTPPSVTESTQTEITVKIRGLEKADLTVPVSIIPPWSSGFDFQFDPATVAPGQRTTVRVTANHQAPLPNEARKLFIASSIGETTELIFDGNNSWAGQYTAPPTATAPKQVAFAVVDGHAPTRSYGSAHLPLLIEQNITLEAPADSSNVLTVGDRQYGPKKASPTGRVAFKVTLHPEFPTGSLASVLPDGT